MARRLTDEEARPVMLAAGLEPLEPYPGNILPWKSKCTLCNEVSSPRRNDVASGHGCKYCARKAVTEGQAIAIMAAAGLTPLSPYPGAMKPWRNRCNQCLREVTPRYSCVYNGQGGCKYCSGRGVDTVLATVVMRSVELEPLIPFPGAHVPWKSLCVRCTREVTPAYSSIKRGQGGCKYCSGNAVDSEQAIKLMIGSGLQPLETFPGSSVNWLCACLSCGRRVKPRYHNIRRGWGGCKYCAFGPLVPAFVYLMECESLIALKIGIGVHGKPRIEQHTRNGWRLVRIWDAAGSVARAAEARVLRNWRKAGIPVACTKEQMPQGGWTETAPLDMVDIAKVRRWVNYEIRKADRMYPIQVTVY